MNIDRKKIVEIINDADKYLLNDFEHTSYELRTDSEMIIELQSTLQLATRQIRFLENRITQLTGIEK